MTPAERRDEWLRYFKAATLKFNALRAVYEQDGEEMLANVLKALNLKSALDVVKTCDDCYLPRK